MPRKPRGEFDVEVGAISWLVFGFVFFCVGYTLWGLATWAIETFL